MSYGLHFQCCLDWLRKQPACSIHLFLIDSPYENTDLAFDKQPVNWAAIWLEIRRVLVPNGVVVCFAAESFTLDLIASNREWYRYRRVWVKSKASRYLDAEWRPLAAHEDVIIFAPAIKSATYNAQRTTYTGPPKSTKRKQTKQSHYKSQRFAAEYKDDGTRHPTTILSFASVGTTAPHFNPTAKPVALFQDLVLTYSNEGDTVAELFAGDAPAGRACQNTARNYHGCETNPEQYEWSQQHLHQQVPLFQLIAA